MNVGSCLFLIVLLFVVTLMGLGFLASETNHQVQRNQELQQQLATLLQELDGTRATLKATQEENDRLKGRVQQLEATQVDQHSAAFSSQSNGTLSDLQPPATLVLGTMFGVAAGAVGATKARKHDQPTHGPQGRDEVLVRLPRQQLKEYIGWKRRQS